MKLPIQLVPVQVERNALALEYIQEAKRKARQMMANLPQRGAWNVEDLEGWGVVGLLKALDRYDATKGELKTWLNFHIENAMLDGVRSMEHRRYKAVEFISLEVAPAILDTLAPHPIQAVLAHEVEAAVFRLRNPLPVLIDRLYRWGLTPKETATDMHITVARVYYLEQVALQGLRRALGVAA